jgi:hypothetical protein
MTTNKLLIATVTIALCACSSNAADNYREGLVACATNSAGGVLCRFQDPGSQRAVAVYWFPKGGVTAAATDAGGDIVDLTNQPSCQGGAP